ncbi:uncharacterized protein LOC122792826 [Protopterus annectens]|uniref:uncharacterized protein LOC122792826 n=1 Tax=Protopterus annectens TaxID=7888 RepID=UPI001CFB09E5|nr:uncharacterized protein LOC122792826 [Protopterus annectens]
MSLTVRIAEYNESVEVMEYFLSFLQVTETTGGFLTDIVLNELKRLGVPLENCRGQGYDNGSNMKGKHSGVQGHSAKAKVTATELAEELEVELKFPGADEVRPRKKRKLFGYEGDDECLISPEQNFKINFFNSLVDVALSSVQDRFTQLAAHSATFGFLYNIQDLCNVSDDELLQLCKDLQNLLTHNDSTDIDAVELYEELKTLCHIMPKGLSALDVLNVMKKRGLVEIFPQVVVALRILLTLPVTVASGGEKLFQAQTN